jgi:hypothetical protein
MVMQQWHSSEDRTRSYICVAWQRVPPCRYEMILRTTTPVWDVDWSAYARRGACVNVVLRSPYSPLFAVSLAHPEKSKIK